MIYKKGQVFKLTAKSLEGLGATVEVLDVSRNEITYAQHFFGITNISIERKTTRCHATTFEEILKTLQGQLEIYITAKNLKEIEERK